VLQPNTKKAGRAPAFFSPLRLCAPDVQHAARWVCWRTPALLALARVPNGADGRPERRTARLPQPFAGYDKSAEAGAPKVAHDGFCTAFSPQMSLPS